MKKLLSIIVSFLVITTSSIPCYASSTNLNVTNESTNYEALSESLIEKSPSIKENESTKIINDLETLASVNIDPALITEIDKIDNKIVYKIKYDNIPVNIITILEVNADYTLYSVTEGEKHDLVKLTSDNKLYLDGKLVKTDVITETHYMQLHSLSTYSSSKDVRYTDTNPLPSAIWVSQYVDKHANLQLEKVIELCTTTVILSFIVGALGTASRAFAKCYDMAADIISAASGTNSTAMSSQITIYYPQGGRHVGGQKYIEKHIGRFWPKKNYAGSVTLKTRYEIIQYY